MLISQTDTAGTLYFLPDAQGSTRALTDSTGALGQTYDYDAFGNLQGDYQSGLDTNYLYTGQQYDVISELYSLRARYYDASIGRFLSRDTWPYDYGNPVELNRYTYAQNNPATYSDPSGYTSLTTYGKLTAKSTLIAAGIRGTIGGFTNVVMEYIFAMMFQTEARPLVAFAEGYVGGVAGYYAGNFIKAGKILKPLLELLVDAAVGVGFDVGVRGEDLGTSILFNLGAGALMWPVEKVGRWAAGAIVEKFPHLKRYFGIDTGSSSPNSNNAPDSPDNTRNSGNQGSDGLDGDGSGTRPGCNSFSADTEVSTPHGDIPISEIDVGDTVLAYNELTGTIGEYEVTHTISHTDEVIIHLYIDGELIETTPEHPFYTDDGEWIDAEDLEVGEEILSLDGDYGIVEKVVVIEDANQPMYNLTVDEAHTFFVGDGDWLVHNVDCSNPDPAPEYLEAFSWFDGDVRKITGSESSKTGPALGLEARYSPNGELKQITLYDVNGNAVYHIDAPVPHSKTEYYWHLHDFSAEPGNPRVGHLHDECPCKVGDSLADVEVYLSNFGVDPKSVKLGQP